jgi:hypothetical protein
MVATRGEQETLDATRTLLFTRGRGVHAEPSEILRDRLVEIREFVRTKCVPIKSSWFRVSTKEMGHLIGLEPMIIHWVIITRREGRGDPRKISEGVSPHSRRRASMISHRRLSSQTFSKSSSLVCEECYRVFRTQDIPNRPPLRVGTSGVAGSRAKGGPGFQQLIGREVTIRR